MAQAFPEGYEIYAEFNVKDYSCSKFSRRHTTCIKPRVKDGTTWSLSTSVFFSPVSCSYSIVTRLAGIEWPLNQESNIPLGGDSPTGSGAPCVAAVRTGVQRCHKQELFKRTPLYGVHYAENNRLENQMTSLTQSVRDNNIINLYGTSLDEDNVYRNMFKIRIVACQRWFSHTAEKYVGKC